MSRLEIACSFKVTTLKRSNGDLVAPGIAYCGAERLVCPRTGRIFDYTRKRDVMHTARHSPVPSPLTESSQAFVDTLETRERRDDAWVARKFIASLHHRLPLRAMVEVVDTFCQRLGDEHGVAVSVAIHAPGHGDPRNWHAHGAVSTRRVNADGTLGAKTRELDCKHTSGRALKQVRQLWQDTQNEVLAKYGIEERVYVGRNRENDPQPTLGPACTASERDEARRRKRRTKGKSMTEVVEENEPSTRIGKALAMHTRRKRRRRARNINLAEMDRSPIEYSMGAPKPAAPIIEDDAIVTTTTSRKRAGPSSPDIDDGPILQIRTARGAPAGAASAIDEARTPRPAIPRAQGAAEPATPAIDDGPIVTTRMARGAPAPIVSDVNGRPILKIRIAHAAAELEAAAFDEAHTPVPATPLYQGAPGPTAPVIDDGRIATTRMARGARAPIVPDVNGRPIPKIRIAHAAAELRPAAFDEAHMPMPAIPLAHGAPEPTVPPISDGPFAIAGIAPRATVGMRLDIADDPIPKIRIAHGVAPLVPVTIDEADTRGPAIPRVRGAPELTAPAIDDGPSATITLARGTPGPVGLEVNEGPSPTIGSALGAPTPVPMQIAEDLRQWILKGTTAAARPFKALVRGIAEKIQALDKQIEGDRNRYREELRYLEGEDGKRHGLVRRLTDMMASRLTMPELTPHSPLERTYALNEMLDPEVPRTHLPISMSRPAMPVRAQESAAYIAVELSESFDAYQVGVFGETEPGSRTPRPAPHDEVALQTLYAAPGMVEMAELWGETELPELLAPIVDEILPWERDARLAEIEAMRARADARAPRTRTDGIPRAPTQTQQPALQAAQPIEPAVPAQPVTRAPAPTPSLSALLTDDDPVPMDPWEKSVLRARRGASRQPPNHFSRSASAKVSHGQSHTPRSNVPTCLGEPSPLTRRCRPSRRCSASTSMRSSASTSEKTRTVSPCRPMT